jgi:hypothetical protein
MALFSLTQVAAADTIEVLSYQSYSTNGGGEFTVFPEGSTLPGFVGLYDPKTSNIGRHGTFQTFCIEGNEFISRGTTYNAVLNTSAVAGGYAGGNPDPISRGTAYLYYQFASGTLKGYYYGDYGDNRIDSARDLQLMIWWLEGESTNFNKNNIFYKLLLNDLGWDEGEMKGDNNGAYGVMAMNLTLNGGRHQDLLIRTSEPLRTPEPFTLLLLGLGLIGVAGIRRKFKS